MDGERERRHSSGYNSGGSGRGGSGRFNSGGRNRQGHRPSRDQQRGERSNRSGRANNKGEFVSGSNSGQMKTPIVLARPDRREQMMPGTISIMQREPPPNRAHPLSPPIRSVTSPGGLLPTPPESHPHTAIKQSSREDHKRPQRNRSDGLSSGPSDYTPLQPSSSGGRGREISRGSSEHFLTGTNEMTHPVKIVDRSLHWEDKGMDFLQDQSDFLVVGVVGKQGVGKSTVMSLLAGTRTGAGKPFMFRTQSKDVWENGGFQTSGIDMLVTGERIILLDSQPVLSESLLEQLTANESMVPTGLTPDGYLEVLSLQMTLFLYSTCHVVIVVMDSMDTSDLVFRFLGTVEQMKGLFDRGDSEIGEKQYYPQLLFVLNHASSDDFTPLSLRELHSILAGTFQRSKVILGGKVSLAKSGLVPVGKGFAGKNPTDRIAPEDVNLHLLPSNSNLVDYGVHSTTGPEKQDVNLNPVFSLLTSYSGHPTFNLLAETLRNQVFAMPRPPLRKSTGGQMTEKDWFDYARRLWVGLKKSDLISQYDRILQSTPTD